MGKVTKKSAGGDDESVILDYLNKQNRPYSCIDIFNNLHSTIGKTAVTKALATLAAESKIIEKEYGKQKVYCARQDQFEIPDEAELDKLDTEIEELKDELKEINTEVKALESDVKAQESSMKTVDIQKKIVSLRKQNALDKERLEKLKSGTKLVSASEIARVNKNYNTALAAWRKRKKLSMDILNQILDEYPKKKSQLFEDIGIETDEDVGVSIASMQQ